MRMIKTPKKAISRRFFTASILWHIFFYIYIHKLIELPGLLESWWTYNGLIYYRDFATFHFPLGRWILLPFYAVSNWNLHIGPFVGLVTNITIAYVIYAFGKKHFSQTATSIALTFFTLFSWYLGTGIMFYHEMFGGLLLALSYCYYTSLDDKKVITKSSAFMLGVVVALTELAGQIATPTIIAFSILFVLKRFRNMFWYGVGGTTPILILSLYFSIHNAFPDFFEQNFLYYTTYANTYEKLPLHMLPLPELTLLYFPLIASIGWLLYTRKMTMKLIEISVLLLSTIPFALFSVFHFHHLSFVLPLASVCVGYLFVHVKSKLISGVFVGALIVVLFPWYVQSTKIQNVGRIVNEIHRTDPMQDTVDWVKKNTPPDATILVAGDALFYFSSKRIPSNKNAYVSPYNWEPLNVTIAEVNSELPDYWVINKTYFMRLTGEYKKNQMVEYIEQLLSTRYTQEVIFQDWEVWKHSKTN